MDGVNSAVWQVRRLSPATAVMLLLLLVWSLALRVWLTLPELTAERFWDEQFGVENVQSLLGEGKIRPANGFHPGLSYLPHAALLLGSEALYRLTGKNLFAVLDEDDELSPTGYFLCRFLQACIGTLSLYLVFRIGLRLFSPGVGLAGALFLAAAPWHLRQSVIFKPDIILLATSLLAFACSLRAAACPTRRNFLLAGGAVGLALASKFNGAPVAVPLTVAALGVSWGDWQDRRRWGRLALAAAAAAGVLLFFTPFLILDPHLYIDDFTRTLRDYEWKGQRSGSSHFEVFAMGVRALLSDNFLGSWVGTLGFLGLGILALFALVPRVSRDLQGRRIGAAMVVAYALAYALFYSFSTTNPSDHNWLPLAPFLALSAAWVLLSGWRWLGDRMPLLRSRTGEALAITVLIALPLLHGSAEAYEDAVPATQKLALQFLKNRLEPLPGRVIVGVGDESSGLVPARFMVVSEDVDKISDLAPERFALADAEVYSATGKESFSARSPAAVGREEIKEFSPVPFRARGAALVVVVHPWRPAGEPLTIELTPAIHAPGRLVGRLPDGVLRGDVLSLEVMLPGQDWQNLFQDLLLRGESLDLVPSGRQRTTQRLASARYPAVEAGAQVVLVLNRPLAAGETVAVRVRRWLR